MEAIYQGTYWLNYFLLVQLGWELNGVPVSQTASHWIQGRMREGRTVRQTFCIAYGAPDHPSTILLPTQADLSAPLREYILSCHCHRKQHSS